MVWKGFPLTCNHITQLFHRQSSIMRMLMNIDPACLKSTPVHLSVECKISEPRVSGKPTIIVHEKMFEVIADSDCIWSRSYKVSSYKVSSSSREQCWKGTRDVAPVLNSLMGVPLLGGHGTVGGGWWCCRSFIDCRMVSCSGQYWGQKFLQGGHYKDPRPVEMVILHHHQKTLV